MEHWCYIEPQIKRLSSYVGWDFRPEVNMMEHWCYIAGCHITESMVTLYAWAGHECESMVTLYAWAGNECESMVTLYAWAGNQWNVPYSTVYRGY